MHQDYARCYLILDLAPGADWHTIRKAYRNLVKKWHPDRFPGDISRRRLAEERIKEITGAYRVLGEYYQKHKIPPPGQAPIPVRSPIVPPSDQSFFADQESGIQRRASGHIHELHHGSHRKAAIAIILTATTCLGFYLLYDEPAETTTPLVNEKPALPSSETGPKILSAQHAAPSPHFTFGSTLGEVITIQGVPTKTEKDAWHYGASTVYFTKGTVSSWQSHPDNPLKASLSVTEAASRPSFFKLGSPKTDVREIQGPPSRETETLWEYGTSTISFKGDRVVGWYESPLYPLRVPR